jgi:hypothetical protein
MTHAQCDCPRCKFEAETSPLGFSVFSPDDDKSDAVGHHVVPGNDIAVHTLDDEGSCACRPSIDDEADGLLYMHKSFDGREAIYLGLRKPS